jgi:phage anti-repressor protein
LGVTDPVETALGDGENAEESQDIPRTVRWAIEQMLNRIDTLEDEFPVPFEVARRIAGYTKKSNATRALVKSFQEGRDYILITPTRRPGSAGRPSKCYALTGKAFKKFCIRARTDQGEIAVTYFIAMDEQFRRHRREARARGLSDEEWFYYLREEPRGGEIRGTGDETTELFHSP